MMNTRGFIPPIWFIVLVLFLFVGLLVGGMAILIKTGFFYVMGSIVAVILMFIGGQASKLKGVKPLRKKR